MFGRWCLLFILITTIILCPLSTFAQTQDDIRAEIDQIKRQLTEIDALKARLADLEKKLEASEKAQEAQPPVTTTFKGDKAKIDGRIFIGTFDSGDEGSYPNWSTDISDARLRFTWTPSDRITVVNRLRSSGADLDGFDYFYLDYAAVPAPGQVLRIGQRKIDVGQETWGDNPVENILISNSVSNVSGYGIGLALHGKLGVTQYAPQYEVGYVNGPRGVANRPTSSIPYNIKLGMPFKGDLFASASYFDSGKLGIDDDSAISVAQLASAPAGSTGWRRRLWELDLRYNYGPTGIRSIIPSTGTPKLMLGATYGAFNDAAFGAVDRDGDYWFVEGLYNLSAKTYTAARYSSTTLDAGVLARLGGSPVPVNSYDRLSLGLGYRLTDLTHLKTEYSFNDTDGGITEPSLNQWAIGVASKF